MAEKIYDLDGARGRHIDVYDDKVVLTTKPGIGSFFTGNFTDGEKTIYFCDCIGIQFRKSEFLIGYLQFETASGLMNNKGSNFFNENTFTWEIPKLSNEIMEEVATYCKNRLSICKSGKSNPEPVASSSAEELKKFKELLDMGVISSEEFEAKKKQILGL